MYKKISIIAVIIIGLALGIGMATQYRNAQKQVVLDPKLSISTSFYPLAYLAEQVGGDKVRVSTVIPNGIEPHDFEPTPQDVITLRSAKVFIYNGNGLETWAENLQSELQNAGVSVVVASQAVTTLPPLEEAIAISSESEKEHSEQGNFDPHIWLDPIRARQIAELIRDTYISVDAANAEYYRAKTLELTNRLNGLHTEYQTTLANCTTRDLVVSHDAFNYLATRYNLTMYAIAGLSPDAEPSVQKLTALTRLIKEKNISTIFFETMASKRLSETLAKETGVRTDSLNPLEGLTADDLAAGKNYETIMRDNLQAISRALICQ